jgi:DNA invertase Pin-like site-specific DNA recombinase
MKAVIYARVSTRIQEEAGSIETQLVRIAKDPIVAARFGAYEDMEQYLDNGVSGRRRPLWDRPGR